MTLASYAFSWSEMFVNTSFWYILHIGQINQLSTLTVPLACMRSLALNCQLFHVQLWLSWDIPSCFQFCSIHISSCILYIDWKCPLYIWSCSSCFHGPPKWLFRLSFSVVSTSASPHCSSSGQNGTEYRWMNEVWVASPVDCPTFRHPSGLNSVLRIRTSILSTDWGLSTLDVPCHYGLTLKSFATTEAKNELWLSSPVVPSPTDNMHSCIKFCSINACCL